MIKYISNLLDFNEATLSGCIDIIAIEHEDGSMVSSPFHVRFGKLKLLKSAQKEVRISVNGQETDLRMRMGKSGEGKCIHRILCLLHIPFHISF
jgi:phosphatidate phosphatase LPIN